MVQIIPEKVVCSQCRSINNYETFSRTNGLFGGNQRTESGKRCLSCGHEQTMTSNLTVSTGEGIVYRDMSAVTEDVF